jgi:PAS domain S-box-containing protein
MTGIIPWPTGKSYTGGTQNRCKNFHKEDSKISDRWYNEGVFNDSSKTVLLVEDEQIVALNQKTMLQRNGIRTRVVHTGEKAVRLIQDDPEIDLVLMDIDLGPGVDGIATARRILALRELPVVFLTGHVEKAIVEQVRTVTWYGYVLKNAGEFVLVEALDMAFQLFELQRKLRKNDQLYRLIHDAAPVGIGVVSDRVIQRVNRRLMDITGYRRDEMVGQSVRMLYTDDEEFERVGREKYTQVRDSGIGHMETLWQRKDGSTIEVDVTVAPLDSRDPHTAHTFTVLDISDRKRAERAMAAAAEEKNNLMKELNHRIKNNLMMIESLISLKDHALGEAVDLSDLRHRVESIQVVHEKLSLLDSTLRIELADYVPELLETVVTPAPTRQTPRTHTDVDTVVLPARTAVSVGLVINELTTNAIKHAFNGTDEPEIRVTGGFLEPPVDDAGLYRLQLEHNGTPMPPEVDLNNPDTLGLGLKLLTSLVGQLNGSITHTAGNRNHLSRYDLTFPVDQVS